MSNLTFELERFARVTPRAPALVVDSRVLTYAAVDRIVWRVAADLYRRGVRPGAVVGHTFTDQLLHAVCMLAVCRLGATVVCLPSSDPPAFRAEMARRTRVSVHLVERAPAAVDRLPSIVIHRHRLFDESVPVDLSVFVPEPDAPALLIVGSGTMGRKKLLPVSHGAMQARTRIFRQMIDMTASDRVACLSPLDYAMANQRLFETLMLGAAFVLNVPGDADAIATCRRERVTVLHSSVFHVVGLLDRVPGDDRPWLDFLRVLRVGSATVPDALRQRILSDLTPNLYIRLGTNDFGPATIARPDDIRSTPGTVGRPGPEVQLRLLRDNGEPVSPGEIGHIWLRSPGMIEAFVDDPEANAKLFRAGWFSPGDMGRLTPDGQLIHCGRADDMMIFNGINVHPVEVEHAMSRHPAVRDVACLPMKSQRAQDIPVCAIAFQAGQRASVEELMRFAHDRLGPQRPRLFAILPVIPRTPTGKLDRDALLRQVAQVLRRPSAISAGRPGNDVHT